MQKVGECVHVLVKENRTPGFHSSYFTESCLLCCNAVYALRSSPVF
jgi:hypothetical protein